MMLTIGGAVGDTLHDLEMLNKGGSNAVGAGFKITSQKSYAKTQLSEVPSCVPCLEHGR